MVTLPEEHSVEGWSIWQTPTSLLGGHIASFEEAWGEAQGLKKILQALTRKSVREKLLEMIMVGIQSMVEAEGGMLSLELGWPEGDDGGCGSSLSTQRAWKGK